MLRKHEDYTSSICYGEKHWKISVSIALTARNYLRQLLDLSGFYACYVLMQVNVCFRWFRLPDFAFWINCSSGLLMGYRAIIKFRFCSEHWCVLTRSKKQSSLAIKRWQSLTRDTFPNLDWEHYSVLRCLEKMQHRFSNWNYANWKQLGMMSLIHFRRGNQQLWSHWFGAWSGLDMQKDIVICRQLLLTCGS